MLCDEKRALGARNRNTENMLLAFKYTTYKESSLILTPDLVAFKFEPSLCDNKMRLRRFHVGLHY